MAKTIERDIERTVTKSYSDLVNWAKSSRRLGNVAMRPNGNQERTIHNQFRRFLEKRKYRDLGVCTDEPDQGLIYDIVLKRDSAIVAAIEVKTPFTNWDGITNKTRMYSNKRKRQPGPLHKDMHSLRTALDNGSSVAYSLVTPIGCYPVDSDGEMVVLDPRWNTRDGNEKAIKARYPHIQWPTRPDYDTNEKHGTPEVDRAMKDFAREHGLKVKRIKGWDRVKLSSPRSDVYTFLDCALYRVKLS